MQANLIILSAVTFCGLVAIFGLRKAPGILLGIAATLSAAWIVSAIFTA